MLGKEENGKLAHMALLGAAFDVLPERPSVDVLSGIATDLAPVVNAPRDEASRALERLLERAQCDRWREAIVGDAKCLSLLYTLRSNYVLFAVLPAGGPRRRILKYSYGEGVGAIARERESMHPARLVQRIWKPDRREFALECPQAWRAASFHAEVAIPEELRIELAELVDYPGGERIGGRDADVDRASLYASGLGAHQRPVVYIVVAPERGGFVAHAALTSVIVAGLLWLGVVSGLETSAAGPVVSIVTAGAALFSGVAAVQGEHRLVKHIFAAPRRWLTGVSVTALTASALLALEIPTAEPVREWGIAAMIASVAALRLVWAFIRALGYRRAFRRLG